VPNIRKAELLHGRYLPGSVIESDQVNRVDGPAVIWLRLSVLTMLTALCFKFIAGRNSAFYGNLGRTGRSSMIPFECASAHRA